MTGLPWLSTDNVAPSRRARLVIDGLSGGSTACRVNHLCHDSTVWARWRRLSLSPSSDVLYHQGSALRVRRSVGVIDASERLSFMVTGPAGGTFWQHGNQRLFGDDLILVDLTAPYDYRAGAGTRSSFQIDIGALGVGLQYARYAASMLRSSPLYETARDHVRAVAAQTTMSDLDRLALIDVASATADLLAALLLSCVIPQVGDPSVRHLPAPPSSPLDRGVHSIAATQAG